jgi:hypothetical protein
MLNCNSLCLRWLGLWCGALLFLVSSKVFLTMSASAKPLLPKLLPHKDNKYLLSFQYHGCADATRMEPSLKRLESELAVSVRRVYVDNLRDAQAVLDSIGHFEGGGTFPFYYNRRTGQAVNGATTFKNLKKWAIGDPTHEFILPVDAADDAPLGS